MDARLLRTFVTIAEAGSVTAASGELRIGQPALSRQLQQLERALRVRLFERSHGRLELTAAGEALLPLARRAVREVDGVTAAAHSLAAGRLDAIHLAATETTRDDVLAPWVATWPATSPMPRLTDHPADSLYATLDRDADLVVSPVPPPRRLASMQVATLPVWASVPSGHPWAGRHGVGLDELAEADDLLLLPTTFHARRALDAAAHQDGLSLEPLAELDSPLVAQAVAASGRGVAVVTDDPRFGLRAVRVLTTAGVPVQVRLFAAWSGSHHAAARLADLARDLAAFIAARYP